MKKVCMVAYHNKTIELDAHLAYADAIIGSLRYVMSLAKDAETGQRGFIITGEAAYLEPYDRAGRQIQQALARVERLTAEDAQQQAKMPELRDRCKPDKRFWMCDRNKPTAPTDSQCSRVTRPDGYHEYYNRRWYDYIGCAPEDCIGFGWSAPIHPEDTTLALERWYHSLRTGEPYELEYRFRSKAS
jgi:PAS domain-containing protein